MRIPARCRLRGKSLLKTEGNSNAHRKAKQLESGSCSGARFPERSTWAISPTLTQVERKQAADWYAKQPWLVGSNYIPATAINELEMRQPDTFDPKRIDLELGWAESIGLNTMRVFLHDLLWQQDPAGFRKRVEVFLQIADKHKVRPIFVLFDSCWDPDPELGKQRSPRPGVHNSGWVQSPGAKVLQDWSHYARLEFYVKGIVGAFAGDPRVMGSSLQARSATEYC